MKWEWCECEVVRSGRNSLVFQDSFRGVRCAALANYGEWAALMSNWFIQQIQYTSRDQSGMSFYPVLSEMHLISYHGQSSRPHPDRTMVEQSADNPLGLMGNLEAHHLQDVVHGSFAAVVHVVHAGAFSQQQIHYVWICVLTGHVQGSVPVLVHRVDVGPRPQQGLAHLEVTLKFLQLLALGTSSIQGRETLIVLFVHSSSVAQVEFGVVWEAVLGCHV